MLLTLKGLVLTGVSGTPLEHEERTSMAAMKPRTGDGPLEVVKEGRSLIMRVPIEGGGRLVLEINDDEAVAMRDALVGVTE